MTDAREADKIGSGEQGGRQDKPTKRVRSRAHNSKMDGVAQSLRKVYQTAVDETVPDEMLELLKRLG